MNPTTRILFVDDNRSLLDGLRRGLRRKARDWEMRFAESGQEAIDLFREQPADVIVTDMRMPGMNGIEVLKSIRDQWPNTIRFVLSGYSDRKMVLDSVGLSHQFFSKPCDMDALVQAIDYSNTLYQHLNNPELQSIVSSIHNLPTPPDVYFALETEIDKSEPSVEILTDIVRKDSAISAKILQLVNSAYFGLAEEVSDIGQALTYIGIDNLKGLVLIVGASTVTFQSIADQFDLDAYSRHSVSVGSIAERIAGKLHKSRRFCQTAFTAGLLHDIGKLVMASHFSHRYFSVDEFHMKHPDTAHTQNMETDRFGINHAEIGAALIGLWGLPPSVVNAVAYHHKPADDSEEELALSEIVHIANALALFHPKEESESIIDSELLDRQHLEKLGLEQAVDDWYEDLKTDDL